MCTPRIAPSWNTHFCCSLIFGFVLISSDMDKTFLSRLDWRFATKKFDHERKVSEEDLAKIIEAIRMTPTAYGIQPYHVYVISDTALRAEMRKSAFPQDQIIEGSHVIVFCVRTDVASRIDQFVDEASRGSTIEKLKLQPMRLYMQQELKTKEGEAALDWTARQTYIALGFALAACAELEIDSCPMEGFNGEEVDALLGVPPCMRSVVVLTIGYRKEGPAFAKTRFSEDDLFTKR